MASANWCKETDEKINYTKLCRLLVDGGTQAVCSVFDGIHPPSSLKAILKTNKKTLQKLRKPKGKVLNNEQWDKLYPPSGSSPKSEDFDITLLFVLLRNICGLTAPATGWDVLPPVTDNSLEANLASIKYYRNNTIAHKPNTEINDADFEQHWQDISSALLSLGLSQDDIDDLKSDPLGKKDYNKLLHDWYISDEDIKIQLQVFKSDTAAIKLDTAAMKSDSAAIKSDSAAIKSNTATIKSDTAAIKSDTAAIKSDTAAITSDTAAITSDTAAITSDTAAIKSDSAAIKSDTAAIKSDTADIKEKLDDITRNVYSEAKKIDQLINKLAVSDFGPEISTKFKSFHPNTRQWILDQVKSHVDSDQPHWCIMLITAGPGMGKSTIAAKICQTYKDLGCLAGCHFFQFSNCTRNNPRLMLQSIARQMCDTVPGYREALESKLQTDLGRNVSELRCEELLTILFEEPLCKVKETDSNFVVVLDALDECSYKKYELLRALRKKVSCLPSWLRFIVTSRPSTNTSALRSNLAVNLDMKPEDQSNMKDLGIFFSFELKALYPQYDNDDNSDLVQKLVELTKGLFLVASFVIEFLKRENVASPEEVLELFPNGISSVYENYFSRLEKVLLPYISEKERFYKMLEAVVATNNPLPKNVFYNILCLKREHDVPREEKKAWKDAMNALHWLFPVVGDHVTAFHKSVVDWLTLEEDEEHDFSVRVEDGNEVLASQCNDVLSDIRGGNKDLDKPLELTDSEKYALRFLCHLVQKHPSVAKADKYGFFSNIYILTALKIEVFSFDPRISNGIIPSSLIDILEQMTVCYPIYSFPHHPSCHFFRPTSFGRYIAFVLQAAHAKGVSEETKPNPLEALKKYRFPYFDKKRLSQKEMPESEQILFKCKEGFIAVFHTRWSNSLPTAIYMYQLDGRLIRSKCFPAKRLIATSPNINFIVVAEKNGNKIEIVDVTTLEVVSQYEFPHDAIQTCHVFGDDQGCFIVIKGCRSNKVFVIEGRTGQVRNTIKMAEDRSVMDVSCQGDIAVTRTWEKYPKPEKTITFNNKDGKVELMNWTKRKKCRESIYSSKASSVSVPSTNKHGKEKSKKRKEHSYSQESTSAAPMHQNKYIHIYRKLFLYHYQAGYYDLEGGSLFNDCGQEPIPIHPLVEKACHCSYRLHDKNVDKAIHISEDGRLLAYHYKDSIFIVNTSDGSLFKRWSFAGNLLKSRLDILFVSESYLVIIDNRIMSVVNVKTDETEHKIYLPYHFRNKNAEYLLFPEEDGKSFTLISSHYKRFKLKVSSLVFHNLNLQGLR